MPIYVTELFSDLSSLISGRLGSFLHSVWVCPTFVVSICFVVWFMALFLKLSKFSRLLSRCAFWIAYLGSKENTFILLMAIVMQTHVFWQLFVFSHFSFVSVSTYNSKFIIIGWDPCHIRLSSDKNYILSIDKLLCHCWCTRAEDCS